MINQLFFSDWEKKIFEVNLPFCESYYTFNPLIPQFASALAHFPFVPIILMSISNVAPSVINNIYNKEVRYFLNVQILLQIVSMIGHLIPNPRIFLIQEISITLTILWLYTFCKLTSKDNLLSYRVIYFPIIFLIISMYLIGLQLTINISSVTIGFFLMFRCKIMDKLTLKSNYIVKSLFLLSFFILALENVYCENLLSISKFFPWHFIFDIVFWQIFSTTIDVIVLSSDKMWIRYD